MSLQIDPLLYESSEFNNKIESVDIDDYLKTIKTGDNSTNINKSSPEAKIYKDEKQKKQVFNEITEKVNKLNLSRMNKVQNNNALNSQVKSAINNNTNKVQNNNALNSQVKSAINNNTNKKTTKQISENDLKNINNLLLNLSCANSIQEYEDNYIKLCEIFYNIWKKYNIKQPSNFNNESIWTQNDSTYTKLQHKWESIRMSYLQNINNKLRELYKNDNRIVNKNILELNDIRTLIKNYIVFLQNQQSK